MMLAEERHVPLSHGCGLNLDGRSAVWARGKRGMMAHRNDVHISSAIETLELATDPLVLRGVVGDDRIEEQDERVSVTNGECRVAVEPARRSLAWDQLRVCREVIL